MITLAAADNGKLGNPPPASSIPSTAAVEQMRRVRRLVREQGMTPDDAAREAGVDPIIAQLWLRLPDDLWPEPKTQAAAAVGPSNLKILEEAPSPGLRRVLTCRIPAPALDRLRHSDSPLIEAAATALEHGIKQPKPDVAPGGWRFSRKPLAVPIPAAAYTAVAELAGNAFNGDLREAAGWLIARGTGMNLPLPPPNELDELLREAKEKRERPSVDSGTPTAQRNPTTTPRFVAAPRRRVERAPLPPDDSAPNGDELRSRREAVGISQRDLAAAAGLSRGLVAEVERGRRRHVLTRLRMAETLASFRGR